MTVSRRTGERQEEREPNSGVTRVGGIDKNPDDSRAAATNPANAAADIVFP